MRTTGTTLALALISTATALILVLATLEAQSRVGEPNTTTSPQWLIFLPLVIPQIAFLPGLQVLALQFGAKGGLAIAAAAHAVFVTPYVWLSLAPAFASWDTRFGLAGATLGASQARIFWRLRLPMLLAPLLTAAAVGMAVSIGQYLPTLMIGGGRVETLTTEALALASGGNRRLIGAYALLQTLLPALGFALALALPRLIHANRRAMLAESRTP
jgi:putative thiamine transport system permease protein